VVGRPDPPKNMDVSDINAEGCTIGWEPPDSDGGEKIQVSFLFINLSKIQKIALNTPLKLLIYPTSSYHATKSDEILSKIY
jgi:hypothetical protein